MKQIEDYPYIMTPQDVAEFFRISEPTAYEYMRRYHWSIKMGSGLRGTVRCFRDDVIKTMREIQAEQHKVS